MRKLPLTFRSEVIGELVAKLRSGESCALVGVGSSGKGNIVRHLKRAEVRDHYFKEDAPYLLYLYVDCLKLPDYTEQKLYARILYVMSQELARLGTAVAELRSQVTAWWRESLTPDGVPFAQHNLETAVDAVLEGPARMIILVLDDCDALIHEAEPRLLRFLRALRDDHKQELMYVTVTRRELACLRTRSLDFESAFELFAAYHIPVKPYREADALLMLDELVKQQKVYPRPLSEAESKRLIEITGGHAGLLKQVYEATGHGERARDADLFIRLSKKEVIRAESAKIWESLDEDEQSDLIAIVRGQIPDQGGLGSLKRKGLVIDDPEGRHRIFSRLFREYVRTLGDNSAVPRLPVIRLDSKLMHAEIDGRTVVLEPVEFDLLQVLVQHSPHPCERSLLINHLMAVAPGGNPHPRLDSFLASLRVKMEPPGEAYFIVGPDGSVRLIGTDRS